MQSGLAHRLVNLATGGLAGFIVLVGVSPWVSPRLFSAVLAMTGIHLEGLEVEGITGLRWTDFRDETLLRNLRIEGLEAEWEWSGRTPRPLRISIDRLTFEDRRRPVIHLCPELSRLASISEQSPQELGDIHIKKASLVLSASSETIHIYNLRIRSGALGTRGFTYESLDVSGNMLKKITHPGHPPSEQLLMELTPSVFADIERPMEFAVHLNPLGTRWDIARLKAMQRDCPFQSQP